MGKTVTLRLTDEKYKLFLEAARGENRPLSNLIETAALERIQEKQFLDDAELAEILEDKELMARIRQGSQDAKTGKGSFVD